MIDLKLFWLVVMPCNEMGIKAGGGGAGAGELTDITTEMVPVCAD